MMGSFNPSMRPGTVVPEGSVEGLRGIRVAPRIALLMRRPRSGGLTSLRSVDAHSLRSVDQGLLDRNRIQHLGLLD